MIQKKSSELSLFTTRFVRRLLFKRLCKSGHPVLKVEDQLIESAALEVQKLGIPRDELLEAVRKSIVGRILMLQEEEDVKSELLTEVNSSSFDELFSKVHLWSWTCRRRFPSSKSR